ncbi:MAG: hypothetical protein U0529_16970 [Thermoanaerobaculia bacterium]
MFSFERVLAAFLILFSSGCYVLVSEVDVADCDRGIGTCSVVRQKVYGEQRASFPVVDLTGAELARLPRSHTKPGSKPALRVVFLTRTGPVPFMGYATGIATGEMRGQVEDVTRFVATPTERTLHLRRDNRISSLVLAAVPLSMAVALLHGSARFRKYLDRKESRGRADAA